MQVGVMAEHDQVQYVQVVIIEEQVGLVPMAII